MESRSQSKRTRDGTSYALISLLAAVLVVHAWSLLRFPAPFVDEAWFAARAWGFLENGQAFGQLDRGVFDQFDGYWTFFPWLPVVLQSVPLRLVSTPILLPLRIESLLFGLALLTIVYSIGDLLYGKQLGLFAALLVAASWFFSYSAHLARNDIITATFGFLAVAIYLRNRSGRIWVSVFSGLCVSLAFEIHAHGAVFGPAVVALFFLHHRWSMFRKRHFWGFVVGVGLGLIFYFALHIARYPASYLAFQRLVFGITHTPPLLTVDLRVLIESVADMAVALTALYSILIVLVVWAVVFLARRRSEADQVLLVLAGSLTVGFVLLIRNKLAYYLILLTPAYDLMIAVFVLGNLCRGLRNRLWSYARWIAILGVGISGLLMNQREIVFNRYASYEQAQAFVDQAIAPDDTVMGPQTYWFGLYEQDYYSWEALVYYQRMFPGSTLRDALEAFRPDVLIIDSQISGYISDDPGSALYSQHLRLPAAELYAFLSDSASLAGTLEIETYGPIQIYRIDWTEDQATSLTKTSKVWLCLLAGDTPTVLDPEKQR